MVGLECTVKQLKPEIRFTLWIEVSQKIDNRIYQLPTSVRVRAVNLRGSEILIVKGFSSSIHESHPLQVDVFTSDSIVNASCLLFHGKL